MKLFEMEGFLRGKCIPADMKVNESTAEYLVRKFSEKDKRISELEAPVANEIVGAVAALSAAISLLEHGGKKGAPSNKMFEQMILDYKRALDDCRAFILKGNK